MTCSSVQDFLRPSRGALGAHCPARLLSTPTPAPREEEEGELEQISWPSGGLQ